MRRVAVALAETVLAAGTLAIALIGAPASPAGAATRGAWTVYHGSPLGSGVAPTGVTFRSATRAWTPTVLTGQIYGEPLEYGGRVFVATEDDWVYALAADTGTVLWSVHLATAVPSSELPCGDIGPTVGVTGTPVVDPSRSEIFVVADESVAGGAQHHLVGLTIHHGTIELDQDVDPPGATPKNQLQRTGLNLDDGNVVFGYGGNDGDCAQYHGWVMSVPEAGGPMNDFEVDRQPRGREGAIWMGGAAPEVDATGNIWVAAGNGSVGPGTTPYDTSDSVIELYPNATMRQIFAPSDWRTDNANDRDLGSTAPALLSDGTVLQVGKSETGYLLDRGDLGGIGGQLTTAHVCTGDADGGDAVSGTVVYVPCQSGLEAVQTGAASITVDWTARTRPAGPPIIAGGLVWSVGGGTLYGLTPGTGDTVTSLPVGSEANHFPTPSVGDGLLLVAGGTAGNEVMAFAGSAGLPGPETTAPAPPPPPQSSYWEVAADGGLFSFGTAPFDGSMGGHPLAAPVVGMARTPDGNGYWEVASDGGIFSFGTATFRGSMGGKHLNAPIVGMAAAPTGRGYWEVASDGGIFTFGTIGFYGSMGGHPLNAPVVGMAATPTGGGYWEVASDGGIFAFGNAPFEGSMGGHHLNEPVVGIARTPTGGGYWEVASDGGIFAFGGADFNGSRGSHHLNAPIVGMASAF